MRSTRIAFALAALLFAPLVLWALTNLSRIDLKFVPSNVGRLFPASSETVKVVVKDERAIPWLVASGSGKSGPYNLYQGFYAEDPRAVSLLVEAGAREAVEILGMKPGEGGFVLDLTIKDFRLEMAWPQFGLINFIGYGLIETSLRSPDGGALASKSFRVASWDTSSKIDVVAAAHLWGAWEAAAKTLLGQFPRKPEPEAVARVLASLDTTKDEYQQSYSIFWLGLVAPEAPAVAEKLFALFRQHENQTVYHAAAGALARLGASGTQEEFEALLAGAKRLKEWDPRGDTEEAWELLHALALLGVTDIAPKVPPPTGRLHAKLTDLVRFEQAGVIPKPTAKEVEELTEKYEKYQRKRKG